jgi:hypothetical protein
MQPELDRARVPVLEDDVGARGDVLVPARLELLAEDGGEVAGGCEGLGLGALGREAFSLAALARDGARIELEVELGDLLLGAGGLGRGRAGSGSPVAAGLAGLAGGFLFRGGLAEVGDRDAEFALFRALGLEESGLGAARCGAGGSLGEEVMRCRLVPGLGRFLSIAISGGKGLAFSARLRGTAPGEGLGEAGGGFLAGLGRGALGEPWGPELAGSGSIGSAIGSAGGLPGLEPGRCVEFGQLAAEFSIAAGLACSARSLVRGCGIRGSFGSGSGAGSNASLPGRDGGSAGSGVQGVVRDNALPRAAKAELRPCRGLGPGEAGPGPVGALGARGLPLGLRWGLGRFLLRLRRSLGRCRLRRPWRSRLRGRRRRGLGEAVRESPVLRARLVAVGYLFPVPCSRGRVPVYAPAARGLPRAIGIAELIPVPVSLRRQAGEGIGPCRGVAPLRRRGSSL